MRDGNDNQALRLQGDVRGARLALLSAVYETCRHDESDRAARMLHASHALQSMSADEIREVYGSWSDWGYGTPMCAALARLSDAERAL